MASCLLAAVLAHLQRRNGSGTGADRAASIVHSLPPSVLRPTASPTHLSAAGCVCSHQYDYHRYDVGHIAVAASAAQNPVLAVSGPKCQYLGDACPPGPRNNS